MSSLLLLLSEAVVPLDLSAGQPRLEIDGAAAGGVNEGPTYDVALQIIAYGEDVGAPGRAPHLINDLQDVVLHAVTVWGNARYVNR